MRQRRNKTATAARLETKEKPRKAPPPLGEHPHGVPWDKRTRAWWKDVWSSPMADEYLLSDTDGLLRLAVLTDMFWRRPSAPLAAEIRLQQQCYGLTPIDRRRLQWEVVRVEEAERKRKRPSPSKDTAGSKDPRDVLRAV